MKFTKQGVRDLNTLPGKSAGKKLEAPPKHQLCQHPTVHEDFLSGVTTCQDCGESWDYDGRPLGS